MLKSRGPGKLEHLTISNSTDISEYNLFGLIHLYNSKKRLRFGKHLEWNYYWMEVSSNKGIIIENTSRGIAGIIIVENDVKTIIETLMPKLWQIEEDNIWNCVTRKSQLSHYRKARSKYQNPLKFSSLCKSLISLEKEQWITVISNFFKKMSS